MVRAPSPFDPHAVSSLRRVVACLLTGHRPAPLRNRSTQLCRFTNSLIELDAVGRIQFQIDIGWLKHDPAILAVAIGPGFQVIERAVRPTEAR
jgi:hypothetical protein